MNTKTHTDIIINNGLHLRRLIAFSKGAYRRKYPNNTAIFNAGIITSQGKVWHGDLDITTDINNLLSIISEINEPLYILHEFDCFDDASLPTNVEELYSRARYIITIEGKIEDGNKYKEMFDKMK